MLLGVSLFFTLIATTHASTSLSDLVLVETKTHSDVAKLSLGETINLAEYGDQLNLRVDYFGAEPGSMQMRLSGPEFMEKIENHPPFTLVGDNAGIYLPWRPQTGEYTLVVEAYAGEDAQGRLLESQTFSFRVIDRDDRQKRELDVQGGSGSGWYRPGERVRVKADTPPRGQRFLRWVGAEGLEKPRDMQTDFIMPQAEAAVAALYHPRNQDDMVTIHGRLAAWEKLTVDLQGPLSSTGAKPNPDVELQYQVHFTAPGGRQYDVPGVFAGNGQGGADGNCWRTFFTPNEPGQWRYTVSFRNFARGTQGAKPVITPIKPYDGLQGTFLVKPATDANNR